MKTSTFLILSALGFGGWILFNKSQAAASSGTQSQNSLLATLLPSIEKLPINDQIAILNAWNAINTPNAAPATTTQGYLGI